MTVNASIISSLFSIYNDSIIELIKIGQYSDRFSSNSFAKACMAIPAVILIVLD